MPRGDDVRGAQRWQVRTQTINRLDAARGQPDTTRVRCRIIQARSLSTRLAINAIFNHGSYLTERIDPREGPAPSLILPDCASPALRHGLDRWLQGDAMRPG